MATLELSFALSAPARRAMGEIPSVRTLEFLAERFFDAVEHTRYRGFAVEPQYYTTAHGYRMARRSAFARRGEKVQLVKTQLTIKTYRGMKRLETRGLQLTWQLEEILFFAYSEGLICCN